MQFTDSEAVSYKFGSIPNTMYESIATLTTVEYGGVFPIAPVGKVLNSVIAVLGLGLFAILTDVFALGTSEHPQEKDCVAESFTYC